MTSIGGTTDPYGRLHKTTGTHTIRMGYDGADLITEYADNGSTILRRYIHGPGADDPLLLLALWEFQRCQSAELPLLR